MSERVMLKDGSFERGYGIHANRYEFVARFCEGKTVLDAGCGIGYGSAILRQRGAAKVVGVDLSEEALGEARRYFTHPSITFVQGNLEGLDDIKELPADVDIVVNLENIEHLHHPEAFLGHVAARLCGRENGRLIVSTPNGELTQRTPNGAIVNRFHVQEFTTEQFCALLNPFFAELAFFGQWLTPAGRTRRANDLLCFEQLCEAYFNPACRLGRVVKRLAGRPVAPPPQFTGEGDSYPWEYQIEPLTPSPYPWPPECLLAVCAKPRG